MSEYLIALTSRATQVTFYEDRARVVRVATARVVRGIGRVRVTGVSPFVDERAVEAAVTGGDAEAKVLSVGVHWLTRVEGAATPRDIEALDAEKVAAERAVMLGEAELRRSAESRERTMALVVDHAGALAHVPAGAREAAVSAAHASAGAALAASLNETLVTEDRVRREVATLRDALEQAEAQAIEARTQEPRLEAAIDVSIEAARDGEVVIELAYRVPCALWRPEHLARLTTGAVDAPKATLEIVTLATIWQRTGEVWEDVEVALSTARPAREADPPLLVEDRLQMRKKAPELRRRVVVQSREETVKTAGLARAASEPSEMPGVDDGGEPIHYRATSRVTLRSDGRPARVEIGRTSLEAVVSRVLIPELSPAAHLKATAVLSRGGPILAGPLRVGLNTTLVGQSKIEFIGKGERFEIGFGADDAIRVRRRTQEERDTTAIVGTQKVRRNVTLFFSNLSGTARSFEAVERLPVSEIEGLEVRLIDAEGAPSHPWTLDPKTGFATAKVTLERRETRILGLAYELRAAPNVVLEA